MVLDKTLESPLDCKDKTSQSKRKSTLNIFGRTDAVAEAAILWSPDAKSCLIGKDMMLGKIEGRRRKG